MKMTISGLPSNFSFHGLCLTFCLDHSDGMQTKRTKKAGIVGKYGKFYIQICLFDIHLLKFIDQWGDVLLFVVAFTLLG